MMCSLGPEMILLLAPYWGMVLWGLLVLGSYWTWGSPRGVSDGLFTILGLVVPVASQALAVAFPLFGLATPASLAVLYVLMTQADSGAKAARAAELEERLEEAAGALRKDPGNAAALLTQAEALEARGLHAQALESYEAAHKASDRMLDALKLAEARDRLAHLAQAQAEPKRRLPQLEYLFLAASALYLGVDPARAVTLAGLMAFALWLRGRQ